MVTINPELQSLIPPLTPDEYAQLEQNILQDGCHDALVVWQEEQTLLDGHNRAVTDAVVYAQYTHCQQHHMGIMQVDVGCPLCMALHQVARAAEAMLAPTQSKKRNAA